MRAMLCGGGGEAFRTLFGLRDVNVVQMEKPSRFCSDLGVVLRVALRLRRVLLVLRACTSRGPIKKSPSVCCVHSSVKAAWVVSCRWG